MKLGIVGLPNVGKSTLFNALTKGVAESANYPFCTIDPNVGSVPVPDERLAVLEKMYNSKKVVPAFVDFVDIAGLVKGASKGEGLGNKFLSHIREVDAIVHVVRCFENQDIVHVDGNIDPARDIETINMELILSDLETMQRRIDKLQKELRASSDKKLKQRMEFLENLQKHLSDGNPARNFSDSEEDIQYINALNFLSSKPIIYLANVSDDAFTEDINNNEHIKTIKEIAKNENAEVLAVSAGVEEEIGQLDSEEEKKEFLSELGLEESGLLRLIKASYHLLGLISFLTAGEKEVRAWTITRGTKAPQAAGKIHTDFEKGFIRAEVVGFDVLVELGSYNAAKEAGKVRIEGKDYVMHENDVVLFRFNV